MQGDRAAGFFVVVLDEGDEAFLAGRLGERLGVGNQHGTGAMALVGTILGNHCLGRPRLSKISNLPVFFGRWAQAAGCGRRWGIRRFALVFGQTEKLFDGNLPLLVTCGQGFQLHHIVVREDIGQNLDGG